MEPRRRYDLKDTMANRFEVDQRAARVATDQRAALFGARSGGANASSYGRAYAHQNVEDQNDALVHDLEAKVHTLKELSLGIGKEASDSNSLLAGMSSVFDNTTSMLKATGSKLRTMMDKKQGRAIIHLVLFIVAGLVFMYVLAKLGGGRGKKEVYTQPSEPPAR